MSYLSYDHGHMTSEPTDVFTAYLTTNPAEMYMCGRTDIRGIVHYEIVPTGQTVNQVYYLEVLKMLREKVRRKRPECFANNSWILHHDNAPAHTALSVREFLATKQITLLEHPPYSPDLAPLTFFCYRR